jgi:L-rhamnonate dehydratase
MQIARIRIRNMRYSAEPRTLAENLVSNASVLEDFHTKPGGWLGRVFSTVVDIETDDGVRGLATAGAFSGAAYGVLTDYVPELVAGVDIRDHERMWQRLYRTLVRFGRRGPAVSALSAIDLACWDAHGRAESKPVVELLGGRGQSAVPVYASRLYANEDPAVVAEEARGYLAQGITRMKQRFGFGPRDGEPGMRRNVALVRAVREAVGDDVELAADAYMGWDFGYALRMAELLREFNLSWLEEPLMPHDVDRYAELRARAPWQRWSGGEHSYTKWDFQELIDKRAVDLLQPDLNRAGGLTEGRKIAALAEAAGLPVIPHSNEAHNLALIFSQSPQVCPVVEYFPEVAPDTGNELFWKLFTGNARHTDGVLSLPDTPGLGVDLDEDLAEKLTARDSGWLDVAP